MASQPPDYLGAMGGVANMVNPSRAISDGLMNILKPQTQQLQNQLTQTEVMKSLVAMQRQQAFGNAAANYAASPLSTDALGQLFAYPEYTQQAQSLYDAMDEKQRRNAGSQLGSAMMLAGHGDYGRAADLAETRYNADKAAGFDDPVLKGVIDGLRSGDPKRQDEATATIGYHMAAAMGVDSAIKFMKANGLSREPIAVSQTEGLYTPQGATIVAPHPNLAVSTVKLPGGKEYPVAVNLQNGQVGPQGAGGGQVVSGPGSGLGATPAAGGVPATGAPLVQAMLPITAKSESGNRDFNPDGSPVVSPKGAKGRMQVMPGTNANPGFGVRPAANDSPEERARVGQDYLAAMMQRYGGDPAKAWAAYNAGPGRLDKALASGPNWLSKMPAATRQYVMANMSQLRGPQTASIAPATATDAIFGGASPTQSGAAAPAAGGGLHDVPTRLDPNTGLPMGGQEPANTEGAPQDYQWNPDHTGVVPLKGGQADPSSYTPGEIYDIAWTHLTTGKWGSGGGMGGGNVPAPIQKVAAGVEAQIMHERGITPQQVNAIRTKNAGISQVLNNATQMAGSLSSAREALQRDGALVLARQRALLDASPDNRDGLGIIRDSGPIGGLVSNSWWNNSKLDWYEEHGSAATQAAVKAYKDAVTGYASTYSKFMTAANGMGGSAAPSNSARGQANELNNFGMGPTALKAHLDTNLAEATNKLTGWQHTAATAQQQMDNIIGPKRPPGGPPAGASNNPGSSTAARAPQAGGLPPGARLLGVDRNTGREVYQLPNGKKVWRQ